MDRLTRWFRGFAFVALLASPVVSHLALISSHGRSVALVLAGAQAVAAGPVMWSILPRNWRGLAVAIPCVLLAGIAWGAAHSAAAGLAVAAGLGHAILYTALLVVFGASLRPGQVALVTRLARRLNPHFHAGMVPYTRAVTWSWCLFAAVQLVLSATLLAAAPFAWWLLLVGVLHGPMALILAVLEFLIRSWRFRGQHTGFVETFRGVRLNAWRRDSALDEDTSTPTRHYPARSGNVTPRPPPAGDSAPGPAT